MEKVKLVRAVCDEVSILKQASMCSCDDVRRGVDDDRRVIITLAALARRQIVICSACRLILSV